MGAVLVYRALTYVLPIGFGVRTYLFWKRNTSWLNSAPPFDPRFGPVPSPTAPSPTPAPVG